MGLLDKVKGWHEKRKKDKNTFFDIEVVIRTPEGCADKTAKWLKPVLLGGHKDVVIIHDSRKDDTICWKLNKINVRKMMSVQRNVAMFDVLVTSVLDNKRVRKLVEADQLGELEDMLRNHTKVEISKKVSENV